MLYMSKEEKTDYKLDDPFFPSFTEVFQAGKVSTIIDNVERSIKWDIYSGVIYCFVLNRYGYFNRCSMSHAYIASNCNCSADVVQDRLKHMESLGIIKTRKDRA